MARKFTERVSRRLEIAEFEVTEIANHSTENSGNSGREIK